LKGLNDAEVRQRVGEPVDDSRSYGKTTDGHYELVYTPFGKLVVVIFGGDGRVIDTAWRPE
jgi:hypothetical protein